MSEVSPAALSDDIPIYDLHPKLESFAHAVRHGLAQPHPSIPPRYFYDDEGSLLFDRICRTPEYYLTRTELAMLPKVCAEVAPLAGADCTVIELGVGMSEKAVSLLEQLEAPHLYAAADINRMALEDSMTRMRHRYPELPLAGIVADFTKLQQLPRPIADAGSRRLCFLPGSTIGNFPPDERDLLLKSIRAVVGETGALLIGADLHKDTEILERAYNDAEGITARFNLNLLHRMQRELGIRLSPDHFRHRAFYCRELQRMEMHLIAQRKLSIEMEDTVFDLEAGDSIHTESSYKFSPEGFAEEGRNAGFSKCRHWTGDEGLFGVFWLTA